MTCCLITEKHAHCAYCDRVISNVPEGEWRQHLCSLECACYAGVYSVREGWINKDKIIEKTGTPKIPWWCPDDKVEEYIAKVTGRRLDAAEPIDP